MENHFIDTQHLSGVETTKRIFDVIAPTPSKNSQRVQLGVHLEEIHEMLVEIDIPTQSTLLFELRESIHKLATVLKTDPNASVVVINRDGLLDAVCDQVVTSVGVAHMYGMDIVGALDEVNRSNNSKFVDGKPIFNEHGKWAKGPSYTPPNLDPFVGTDPTELIYPI